MDFAKARFNMVEQQIRPWDVLDFDILDALDAIPREAFVSRKQQGYASAVLAKLAGEVVTVDIDPEQQQRAKTVLESLGFDNIIYAEGDGLATQNAAAPFDAIYVGGAAEGVPEVLKNQLKDGGRLVIVTGRDPVQRARLITREGEKFGEKVLFDTMIPYLSDKTAKPFGDFDF